MAFQDKKFLDAAGITHLVRLLDEYPNNQVLGTVIDAIEGELEQKAEKSEIPEVPVQDVQIDGTSIINQGVANIPVADAYNFGLIKVNSNGVRGLAMTSDGYLANTNASTVQIKTGTDAYRPITPNHINDATFYGLAKAAGDSTQSASSNAVGAYTETAKSKIHTMLNSSVAVSGTTPTITGQDGIRYVCGEVSTISITPPTSGIIDVVFDSGTTPAVLTIVGNVRWANGFDPDSLDADTTYEINIADGLGVVGKWT